MNERDEHAEGLQEKLPVDEQMEARLAELTAWTGATETAGGSPLGRALVLTANDAPAVAARAAWWRGLTKKQIAAVLLLGAGGLLVAGMVVPSIGRRAESDSAGSEQIAMNTGAPESTQKSIREMIERVRSLQRERRYAEAVQVSEQILFLDPQNKTGLLLKNVLSDMASYQTLAQLDPEKSMSYSSFSVDSTREAKPREHSLDNAVGWANGSGAWKGAFDIAGYPSEWPTRPRSSDQNEIVARQIIRRAMVDIVATDVQVTFRTAQDLIKVELGEFVQESTLSGSGKAMSGRVVLRIEPKRLAEVMQACRGLGELASEQTGGDDVTDRLTDLDAQIRNEERVEKEMLELFDLRKDAPLKEVLELREQLARVRGNIERMQASKSQMGRLVSLATLSITIRPKPDVVVAAPPVDETPSFGARLGNELGRSWDRATNNLVSSAGWVVETAIGGLPTWTVLGVTGFVIWRVVRKRQKKA